MEENKQKKQTTTYHFHDMKLKYKFLAGSVTHAMHAMSKNRKSHIGTWSDFLYWTWCNSGNSSGLPRFELNGECWPVLEEEEVLS